MFFPSPLTRGRIQRRYKRFLADVLLDTGETVTAHVANTGPMETCWQPHWEVLLSYHDESKRKYPYSLEMVHNGRTWIGVNTSLANTLVQEGIERGTIKELCGHTRIQREVPYGHHRLDFLLHQNGGPSCYVEVKNVTFLSGEEVVSFPDTVSERGQRHLLALTELSKRGLRTVIFFVVNREDGELFTPAIEKDPAYAQALHKAFDAGVEILAYRCRLKAREIVLSHPLPCLL